MAEKLGVMAEDVRARSWPAFSSRCCQRGDQIDKGDVVVLLESMKMEIPSWPKLPERSAGGGIGGRCHSGRRPYRGNQLIVDSHSCPHSVICSPDTVRRAARWTCMRWSRVCYRLVVCRLPDVGSPRRRVLVCIAQYRPNTGPTVVHTDAVGTVICQ